MKIIKEGKIPTKPKEEIEHIYRITCKKCKCEFECNEEEIKDEEYIEEEMSLLAFGAGRDINKRKDSWVKCPCCKEKIIIKQKLLSSEWKPWLE